MAKWYSGPLGLKLADICLTGEEKSRKIITQETCHDRGSNPGLQRDRRACYRLTHGGGLPLGYLQHLLHYSFKHPLKFILLNNYVYAMKHEITISLSKFNLPLMGTFTWPTPPGPYRATTCRGRELNYVSHIYFFEHTRTWRVSPDEWSAQCRGHLRDSTNMKDNTHQAHTQSFQQSEYGMMITTAKW